MATPTYDRIKWFKDVHVATWNSGDREDYLNSYREFLIDDDQVLLWDPVGTPPRRGLKAAVADPYDLWQPVTRLHVPDETFRISGNEACWVTENHLDIDGRDVFSTSIENHQFREDGSIHIRAWWEVPPPDSEIARAFGKIMAKYLPGADSDR